MGVNMTELERIAAVYRRGRLEFCPHPYTSFSRHRTGRHWSRWADGIVGDESTPTVVCIGGSTTEGGNPHGDRGRYPFLLREKLKQGLNREVAVFNGGVSGWTSAESLCAYFLEYQDFDADVLLIHHAINDVGPMWLDHFDVDYTHYRKPMTPVDTGGIEGWFVRNSRLFVHLGGYASMLNINELTTKQGEPGRRWVSELSQEARDTFVRNLESIGRSAEAKGARVGLLTMPGSLEYLGQEMADALELNNELVRECAMQNDWLLIDLSLAFREVAPEFHAEQFLDGVHLTPKGNASKAHWVAMALYEDGAFDEQAADPVVALEANAQLTPRKGDDE